MFAPMYATPDRITSNLTATAADAVVDWNWADESEQFRFLVEVFVYEDQSFESALFHAESEATQFLRDAVHAHQGEGEFSLYDGEFYYHFSSPEGTIGIGPSQRIDIL